MRNIKFLSLFSLITIMFIGLNSCKKETVDVTHLLKTVPSSAAGVVVLNVEDMLEGLGCKVKDHKVEMSKELTEVFSSTSSSQYKENLLMLFNGDAGIEPKGAVVFYDSNRAYLTFALCDVKKFCDFVEAKQGIKFSEESGSVKVAGKIAVKGSQAWVCLSVGKRIDPDGISSYSDLATAQSFLVTPMGEKLLVEEDDIRGWALINTFLGEILGSRDANMANLGLGFLFENAEAVSFKLDFDEGEIEGEALILNDKGKPAKYLLSSDKVDVNTLKSLGGTCDAMMAFTINPKLIKKFDQLGSLVGGALFGDLSETFKNVDGTVGIITGSDGMDATINGVVTTKGDLTKALKDMISQNIAPVKEDGKFLRFTKGEVKGSMNVEECAEELKGCCVGLIFDASGYNNLGYGGAAPGGLKTMTLKLKPESGGLELSVEVKTDFPKENSLLTLIKRK